MLTDNSYTRDLRAQADTLEAALTQYPAAEMAQLARRYQSGEFDRLVITGMGSSHNALYPAQQALASAANPPFYINTAELLHYASGLVTPRTLLWINSQSGKSAELVNLLQRLATEKRQPAFQMTLSNDPASPIATAADLCIPLHAGTELTVSTKTYLNMLALSQLAAAQLLGQDHLALLAAFQGAVPAIRAFLGELSTHADQLDRLTEGMQQAVYVGRGPSMAAVTQGSLTSGEAAKFYVPGLNVADFRHGPFEIVDGRLTVFILQGQPATRNANERLAQEVSEKGGKVVWLATQKHPIYPTFLLPNVPANALSLVEILPFQVMTLVLAARTGFEPGVFRHISKVTETE